MYPCGIPMVYKNPKQHNIRRRQKKKLDAIESVRVCYHCGSKQAYLLTVDVDNLTVHEIKKLDALCLNCLTKENKNGRM